jgi:hypothetical protein
LLRIAGERRAAAEAAARVVAGHRVPRRALRGGAIADIRRNPRWRRGDLRARPVPMLSDTPTAWTS